MRRISYSLAVMLLAGVSVNASTINLDLSLVANYTFQQNASDVTGNVSNSHVGGQQTTGVYGNGWQFSQGGEQVVGTSAFLPTGNSSRTISAWIRADSSVPGAKPIVLGGISPSNNADTFGIMYNLNSNDRLNDTNNWEFWGNSFQVEASAGTNSFDLQWHHHVLSFDQSSGTAYYFLDTQLKTIWAGSLNTFGQKISLGKITEDSNTVTFIGALDEVRVYSRAITSQEEINALYAVPEPSSLSLLLAGVAVLMAGRRRNRD